MSYRDDHQALLTRLEALERQLSRTEQLEQRVQELEQENRRLRQLAKGAGGVSDVAAEAAPPPSAPAKEKQVHLDARLGKYAALIVEATRAPQGALGQAELADYLLSGARPDAIEALLQAARDRAVAAGRAYVVPGDLQDAAPDVLAARVILNRRAEEDGVTAAAFVNRVLELIEVP